MNFITAQAMSAEWREGTKKKIKKSSHPNVSCRQGGGSRMDSEAKSVGPGHLSHLLCPLIHHGSDRNI